MVCKFGSRFVFRFISTETAVSVFQKICGYQKMKTSFWIPVFALTQTKHNNKNGEKNIHQFVLVTKQKNILFCKTENRSVFPKRRFFFFNFGSVVLNRSGHITKIYLNISTGSWASAPLTRTQMVDGKLSACSHVVSDRQNRSRTCTPNSSINSLAMYLCWNIIIIIIIIINNINITRTQSVMDHNTAVLDVYWCQNDIYVVIWQFYLFLLTDALPGVYYG